MLFTKQAHSFPQLSHPAQAQAAVQHLKSKKKALERKLEDLLDLRLDGSITNDEHLTKRTSYFRRRSISIRNRPC